MLYCNSYFISPLIAFKYIATEKIVTDQLPHNLRCGQIVVFRILHEGFFVFSWKADSYCSDVLHSVHSFHSFMEKSVRQVNTGDQENGASAVRMIFRCANAPVSLSVSLHSFRDAVFSFDLLSPDEQMKSNQEKKN